ncbi:MAG: ferritin-like domain-containing protein, partial [Actinomycetota bacterium]|nr:ferritin-like domain-containing protein [Actinomycetota bacterium]
AEDQARFAFETIAARSPEGGARNRARAAADRHAATSQAWARLASLTGPGLDPRAVSYALDGAADTPESRKELGGRVEQALVVSYAALVALAEPGSRAELAELHTLAAESARRWGERPTAFPGIH